MKKRSLPAELSDLPSPKYKSSKSYHDNSAESEKPFEYTPLKENEFRLLEILPGSESEHVSCRLVHATLEAPVYSALSYAWGTQDLDMPVIVNDQILFVKPNLEAALRELRREPVWFVPTEEPHKFREVERSLALLTGGLHGFPRLPPRGGDLQVPQQIISLIHGGKDLLRKLRRKKKSDEAPSRTQRKISEISIDNLLVEISTVSTKVEDLWNAYAREEGLPLLHHESHLMWIDAICINQKDLKERSEQVQLMQKIYKDAKTLVVWLGDEADGSTEAIVLLDAFSKELKVGEEGPSGSKPAISFAPFLEKQKSPTEIDRAWEAVINLFARPWFQRIWMRQEFALGAHRKGKQQNAIVYCCGRRRALRLVDFHISVAEFKTSAWSSGNGLPHPDLVEKWCLSRDLVGTLNLSRLSYKVARSWKQLNFLNLYRLLPLVADSKNSIATDPRDRIYAIVGLAKELYNGELGDFDPNILLFDYAASVEDVYSSFVKSVVTATKRIDILGFGHQERKTNVRRTWTPDWSCGYNECILTEDISDSTLWKSENWTFNVSRGSDCKAKISANLSTLTVSGILWDEIIVVSSNKFGDAEHRNFFRYDCQSILNLSRLIGRRTNVYHSEEELDLILLEILTLDRKAVLAETKLPDFWVERFRVWMRGDEERRGMHIEDEALRESFSFVMDFIRDSYASIHTDSLTENPDSTFSDFLRVNSLDSNKIILTKDGYMGRCWNTVQVGDIVCILLGCAMPMVLRPVEQHYELVG
jgi:hypothetical protein